MRLAARRLLVGRISGNSENKEMLFRYPLFGRIAQTTVFLTVLACALPAQAQAAAGSRNDFVLPAGASAKKADEFLATLRPPTSLKALESGNDLLLEFPAIAAAGPIPFKAVSTMPRTDGMWLISLSPQPESGVPLFASVILETSALPEISLLLNLAKTQSILLVARAGGKYYGLQREIKVGIPMTGPIAK
jgi:hypothetical protein